MTPDEIDTLRNYAEEARKPEGDRWLWVGDVGEVLLAKGMTRQVPTPRNTTDPVGVSGVRAEITDAGLAALALLGETP